MMELLDVQGLFFGKTEKGKAERLKTGKRKPKAYGLKPFLLWLFPNELVISYDRETKRSRIFWRKRG